MLNLQKKTFELSLGGSDSGGSGAGGAGTGGGSDPKKGGGG